jgi:hypothetical protein
MSGEFKLSWKAWVGIVSIVLFYIGAAVSSDDLFGTLLYGAIGVCIAGVAAFDSTHIHLRRYRTALSYGPVGLFMVCALFWPVVIIWYFIVRVRIARGTMPLRA